MPQGGRNEDCPDFRAATNRQLHAGYAFRDAMLTIFALVRLCIPLDFGTTVPLVKREKGKRFLVRSTQVRTSARALPPAF